MYRLISYFRDKPLALYEYKKYKKYKKYSVREISDCREEIKLFKTDDLDEAIKMKDLLNQYFIGFEVEEI